MTPRRLALLAAAALAGAVPATTALASHGADDGPGTTTAASTTQTTTGTSPAPAPSATRSRAIAAAKAAVREDTRVLRVRRESHARWEVRLAGASTRYTVRLDRDLDVLRVRREALHPAGAGSDDGTADQGSGDAPGTAGSHTTTTATSTTPAAGDDDGTADQGSGDAPGTPSSGGGSDDGGHHGGGSDDGGGHHGGHGSDD